MTPGSIGRVRALVAIGVAVAAAACLAPALALARAGGGQVGGFSGGGFSGGGLSGGGFGGGFLGGLIGGSAGSGGGSWVFIIIVVLVIWFVVIPAIRKSQGGSGAGMAGIPGPGTPGGVLPPMPGDPYAPIRASDPDFSDELFLGRVNEMFIAIQYAWMARDMEPVRRFLADQQFTVLQNGVKEYVLNGTTNMLGNVHITEMHPVEVTREGDFDSVKLLITAICIDYTINEATKEIVNPAELGDGKTPREFQEYWTFMRKSGAKTKADASIQKCPNCGAPVTDGNYVKCAYCGVQMNDPTLDWVLMRIEQV
jgi:hypothetical protein